MPHGPTPAYSAPASTAVPETLAAEFQDQMVRIFGELGTSGRITLVLDFDRPLDEARLARATRLLHDGEPVLGCRFDTSAKVPVWRRRADLDTRPLFTLVEAAEAGPEIDRMLVRLDQAGMDDTDNLAVLLVRRPGQDTLAVSVEHAVADGGAALECVYRLAEIYTALGGDPSWRPQPNPGSRDSFVWAADLTWRDRLSILRRDMQDAKLGKLPADGLRSSFAAFQAADRSRLGHAVYRIEAPRVREIERAGKARTLMRNTLLVAGFARAWAAWRAADGARPAGTWTRIVLPANLRVLTKPNRRPPICNLGGIAHVTLGPDLGPDFAATVAQASADLDRLRRFAPLGVGNPVAMAILSWPGYAAKRRLLRKLASAGMSAPVPPVFTNVGRLDGAKARFDGPPRGAYVLGPSSVWPIVVVGVLEYDGAVSFAAGFPDSGTAPQAMAALLADIDTQIDLASLARGNDA